LIITSIANASQAAIDLTNALKLVNREQESIETNARVQECLTNAKASRKSVIRYIQRVENEELIGTLLDANERIIVSLQLYDQMLKSAEHDSDEDHDAAEKMEALSLQQQQQAASEISKLQGKQRAAIQRATSRSSLDVISGGISRPTPMSGKNVHPDLQDLQWAAPLGHENSALPAPLRPHLPDEQASYRRGSLSDYSDYTSEEDDDDRPSTSTAPTSAAGHSHTHGYRAYDDLIGDEDELVRGEVHKGLLSADDDPFADPFADNVDEIGTPMIEKRRMDTELR